MARAPWAAPAVYDAAQRWVNRCLREDGSLYSPNLAIWTRDAIAAVQERLEPVPPVKGSFSDKLRWQAAPLPPQHRQLLSEMVFVLLLPESDTRGPTKQASILAPVEGLEPAIEIPFDLLDALNAPDSVASYGRAKNLRGQYLEFLATWLAAWKQLSSDERERLLSDPWLFRKSVKEITARGAGMQAEAILHLVFPDVFEYALAPDHKEKIALTFSALPDVAGAESVDQKLRVIRQATTDLLGTELNLYGPSARDVWRQPPSPEWDAFVGWAVRLFAEPGFDADERDYKLQVADRLSVAREAVEGDEDDWHAKLKRAFGPPNNLTSWRAHGAFLDWCSASGAEARKLLVDLWSAGVDGLPIFLDSLPREVVPGPEGRLAIGSFLLLGVDVARLPVYRAQPYASAGRLLGLGSESLATDELDLTRQYDPEDIAVRLGVPAKAIREFLREEFPRDQEEKGTRWWPLSDEHVEAVVAQFGRKGVSGESLAARYSTFLELLDELSLRMLARGVRIRDRLDAQSLLWWVSSAEPPDSWSEEDKDAFLAFQKGAPVIGQVRLAAEDVTLITVGPDLADSVYLPREWLQSELVDLLAEKRQIILYGPPGTGKTFVAQRIAEHLTSGGGTFELVQFHPSYSYEDFFEGYRPKETDGDGVAYELTHGPLRRIAQAASTDPDNPYILVVDEINRGNLPKIFGELLFLLEYREAEIALQYSPETHFGLPRNLFIIGTMNTADRSIALVDAALRRRFYFVPFMPREEPIRSVLERWLTATGRDLRPARLLAELNARIANDEIAIGPSYLMTPHSDLERVWKHAILPVLEEHYYGTGRDVAAEFGLASLEASLVSPELAAPDETDSAPEAAPEAAL